VKNNNATPLDVVTNPKKLKLVALDAAQLPRSLDDLTIASINNDYAEKAGLSLNKDAVIKEAPKSPYANLIAVRRADKDKPWAKRLVAAYQSPEVKSFIETQVQRGAGAGVLIRADTDFPLAPSVRAACPGGFFLFG
jgi:D-methionine transport system substrate-binding protein